MKQDIIVFIRIDDNRNTDELIKRLNDIKTCLKKTETESIIQVYNKRTKRSIRISDEIRQNRKSQETLLEYLLRKSLNPTEIKNIFKEFLDGIDIEDELIIIDPYLFPKRRDPDYKTVLLSIVKTQISKVNKLKVITSDKFDPDLKDEIENELRQLKNTITFHHKISDEFHDRFWLSNKKGLLVGTSLNGVGKKYSLINNLAQSDFEELMGALKTNELI